jgi:superfamily II DNA helicase RecQ
VLTTGVLPLTTVLIYSKEEIYKGLKKVLNQEKLVFRSDEQKKAVFAAIDQQSPLVIILLTKGRKTLTFTLPTVLQEPGVTIVVALFNTLEKDYIRRLWLSHIKHVVWCYKEARYAPVIVVSADQAVSTGFITYVLMPWKKKLLRQIVLNECYLTFTASDYQPKLKQLGYLQVLWCLIILLTATLSLIQLNKLREIIHISDFCLICIRTARLNICYIVWRCPNKSVLQVMKKMARLRKLGKGEQGIFYCSSRDRTEEVAKALGCLYYYLITKEKNKAIEK